MKASRRVLRWIVALIALATCAFDVAEGNHYILPCADQCSPSWVFTGDLNTARMYHTATLLQDGRVLVVGGRQKVVRDDHDGRYTSWTSVDLDSAELYDPVTGAWIVTGRLSQPRVFHTATLLPDGRVLVAGGSSIGSDGATAEIYDPVTATWAPTGNMTTPRAFHTATLLQNGKVLVVGLLTFGGYTIQNGVFVWSPATISAELYDPVMGTWRRTGAPNIARYAHTATLLQDGKVLVAGGSDDEEGATTFDSAELYDPVTEIWTSTGNLKVGRNSHTATLLANGNVLVAAGWSTKSSELYDPTAAQWTVSGTLNSGPVSNLASHTATLLTSGDVLVVGGAGSIGYGPFPVGTTDDYDPDSGTWSLTSGLNESRFGHTATMLRDGRLLVVGGSGVFDQYVALATAEVYGTAVPVLIGSGFTGSWYDPSQSGQGLFIEVLPSNRLLAGWFTFNPAGTEQAWFTGVGTYSGNSATISAAEMPTGGRWIPNFDATRIAHNAWGTLTFTFTDCDHGKVDFNSVAGYGMGSMNLTRLTQPAGLTCP